MTELAAIAVALDLIIRKRDEIGILTHIEKVISHTGVTHNDMAEAGARGWLTGRHSRISYSPLQTLP